MRPMETIERRLARWLPAVLVACAACASGAQGRGAAGPAPGSAVAGAPAADVNRMMLAVAAADSSASVEREPAEYEIGPGDRVRVDVFGAETFSGVFTVDDAGGIAIPLVGGVPAGGSTPRELEDVLEARLKETYMRDPHVTVHVDEMRSHGVSVLGAVNRPGVYQVSARTTLLDVLAMAEGLSETAGSTVVVMRRGRGAPDAPGALPGGDEVDEVDLGSLLSAGGPRANLEVRPGDIVQVRPAALVYVVGEVNRPGGFTVPFGESMTVLQALAMAQGLGGTAAASRSVIVRDRPDGSREEIPVDLDEVLDGSDAPPVLGPSDVLFVPNNDTKSTAIGVVNALVRMVTFRGLVY